MLSMTPQETIQRRCIFLGTVWGLTLFFFLSWLRLFSSCGHTRPLGRSQCMVSLENAQVGLTPDRISPLLPPPLQVVRQITCHLVVLVWAKTWLWATKFNRMIASCTNANALDVVPSCSWREQHGSRPKKETTAETSQGTAACGAISLPTCQGANRRPSSPSTPSSSSTHRGWTLPFYLYVATASLPHTPAR